MTARFFFRAAQQSVEFARKARGHRPRLQLTEYRLNSAEPLGLVRPPSVRIRIEHWELNIGQIPIAHSAKLFLRKPVGIDGRPSIAIRHRWLALCYNKAHDAWRTPCDCARA